MTCITKEEFQDRLCRLCLKSGSVGLPRRLRDQHILMKSITLLFEPDRSYSGSEVRSIIRFWLADIAVRIQTDHAALRRALVDHGYLTRNPAGSTYAQGRPAGKEICFDPAVDSLDVLATVSGAAAEIERKKRDHRPQLP